MSRLCRTFDSYGSHGPLDLLCISRAVKLISASTLMPHSNSVATPLGRRKRTLGRVSSWTRRRSEPLAEVRYEKKEMECVVDVVSCEHQLDPVKRVFELVETLIPRIEE